MEDKIAALSLQQNSLQELIETLKDGRGAQKVLEWHSKIDGVRLEELQQKRNCSKLHQKVVASIFVPAVNLIIVSWFSSMLQSLHQPLL